MEEHMASSEYLLPRIQKRALLRRSRTQLIALASFSVFAIFIGGLDAFAATLPDINPIYVPSRCKILSSTVDLRSSKVCELSLLNYKAKHTFHSSEGKKFWCRYDYYWASVFKVEYEDHAGQAQISAAEIPSKSLPLECRPDFSTAWLTKDKFKLNETYKCLYASTLKQVNFYDDSLFDCQIKASLRMEIITWLLGVFSSMRFKYLRWEAMVGFFAGLFTPFLSYCLVKIVCSMKIVFRIGHHIFKS